MVASLYPNVRSGMHVTMHMMLFELTSKYPAAVMAMSAAADQSARTGMQTASRQMSVRELIDRLTIFNLVLLDCKT